MAVTFQFGGAALAAATSTPVGFPPGLSNNRIVGFDVQNMSVFPLTLVGVPGGIYTLEPYTGMYIPVLFAETPLLLQPLESKSITVITGPVALQTNNAINNAANGQFIQFTAFLDGDPLPSQQLIPYQLPLVGQGILQLSRQLVVQATNVFGSTIAAHTIQLITGSIGTLNGSGGNPGLYLLALGFQFLAPSVTPVNELITLTDAAANVIMQWDMPLSNVMGKDLLFSWPGLLTPFQAGELQWNLNSPATTNGPAVSMYLYGYVV